jgi:hypothetical protein
LCFLGQWLYLLVPRKSCPDSHHQISKSRLKSQLSFSLPYLKILDKKFLKNKNAPAFNSAHELRHLRKDLHLDRNNTPLHQQWQRNVSLSPLSRTGLYLHRSVSRNYRICETL